MQAALHSPFLQALGYAIANSIWQTAIVWVLFSFAGIIIKPISAVKFRMAITAQLLSFFWFIFTFQFYFIRCTDAFSANNSLQQSAALSLIFPDASNSFSSFLFSFLIKAEQLLPFLSFAYLLLLLVLLVRWISLYRRTQFIRSNGLQQIEATWQQFVQEIAGQLKIYNTIEIYVSELISSPLTIGFLKPVILVPLASINHLTIPQLEAVLLHELAHIKRFDYILNIFISVIETILFFNPFTQLISKSIKSERENSCDDWVLQFKYNPAMYAEALLQIAYLSKQTTHSNSSPLSMYAAKQSGDLSSRVKRMIGVNDTRFRYRHQLISLFIITCIISSLAWFRPIANSSAKKINQTAKTESIIVEPMSATIDNPLFNPVFFLKKPLRKEVEKSIDIAVKSMQISDRTMKRSFETLSTITPAAINSIRNFNITVAEKEIENNNIEMNIAPHISQIKMDSSTIKKSMQIFKSHQLYFTMEKINAELLNSEKELTKVLRSAKLNAEESKKNKDEISKAIEEIERLNIPFMHHLLKPVLKNELNSAWENADSTKANHSNSTASSTEKINDEIMLISENNDEPSIIFNHALFSEKINSTINITKKINPVKNIAHQKNKEIEIIIKQDENAEPVRILIEINYN